MVCKLCPRKCGEIREDNRGEGVCGMPKKPVVARFAPHFWEEPCISGTKGSGTVFFSGCVLGCVFCQNHDISRLKKGELISTERLADIFAELESMGVHNINLVTPTHYVHEIIAALKIYRPNIPIVYNCGGYERTESIRALRKYVDVFLTDLKFYSKEVGERYANAPDYFEVATRALLCMREITGAAQYDSGGLMIRGTLVRHLILPGYVRETFAILRWCENNLPEGVPVSVMAQYVPCGDTPMELSRRISRKELGRVEQFISVHSIDGYVQSLESADECYIPQFYDTL